MAPQKKNISLTGVIYEPNNFIAFTTVDSSVPKEFHSIMKFLGESKLGYYLHEAPTIQCELLEELWATTEFKEEANEISFICKGKSYNLSTSVLGNVLRLPENNCSALASDEEVRQMLNDINYGVTPLISQFR